MDIPKFLEKMDMGYSIVNGWKRNRTDNLLTRRMPALVINRLTGFIFGINLRDIASTYKAYRKEVIKNIKLYGGFHRFIPVLINKKEISICEIEVRYNKRNHGKSHYNLSRMKRVILDIFLLWVARKKNMEYSPGPIYSIKEVKSHS